MSFVSCGVCSVEKKELYTCPKCSFRYCSIKCYRNEKHSECSEKFYQERVKESLSGKKFDLSTKGEDYKEKMEKFMNGDWNAEEGEPLDSDDEEAGTSSYNQEQEEKEYAEAMRKVVEETIDKYDMDDGDISRQLIGLGLSEDVDELLNTLTPDEREAFKQLAEEMQQEEQGLGQSCFSTTAKKI